MPIRQAFTLWILLLCLLPWCQALRGEEWEAWRALSVHTPFLESSRTAWKTLHRRTISVYGAPRTTYVSGHLHAGIDLKGKPGELVYPIALGTVVEIQLSFPNRTVVVRHDLPDQPPLYSRYTHVEEIQVGVGDTVDPQTPLARLFTRQEQQAARFGVIHLHLEIRKRIDDGCSASWTATTREALDTYCVDPLVFFKATLHRPHPRP